MLPPTVRFLAPAVTVRLALSVTAPAPRSRSPVPVKVKLAHQLCGLLGVNVMPPLGLSIVTELVSHGLMLKVPEAPRAVALLIFNVPLINAMPPVQSLGPPNVMTPGSDAEFNCSAPPPVILPGIVSIPAPA